MSEIDRGYYEVAVEERDALRRELTESRQYAQFLRVEAENANKIASAAKFEIDRLVAELHPYAKRCDRFSAALERIMEICQEERAPYQLQIFEIAEDALIEEESAS